jgi:hypothetical protein
VPRSLARFLGMEDEAVSLAPISPVSDKDMQSVDDDSDDLANTRKTKPPHFIKHIARRLLYLP